jgi:hypothetical protein
MVQTVRLQDGRTAFKTNAQGQQLFAPAVGDYSIADGQISTTEPNYRHLKIDGKEPAMVKVTYADSPSSTTDATGTHTTSEAKLLVEEVKDLDIKVAGEPGFGGSGSGGRSTETPQSPLFANREAVRQYMETHFGQGAFEKLEEFRAAQERARRAAERARPQKVEEEVEEPQPPPRTDLV